MVAKCNNGKVDDLFEKHGMLVAKSAQDFDNTNLDVVTSLNTIRCPLATGVATRAKEMFIELLKKLRYTMFKVRV